MKGIDVSLWNGNINWAKVAKTDVDFAIIRCADSKRVDDPNFEKNTKGCEKYNIPYGVYLYSTATSTTKAMNEACQALRMCQNHKLKFPIYYDMEHPTQARLSKKKRGQIAKTFLSIVSDAGYKVGVYANLNWWNNYLPSSVASNSEWYKWVAAYRNTCEYKGTYQMWQCTSLGRVNGIKGGVDLNFWIGKYSAKKLASNQGYVTVVPDKTSVKKITVGRKKLTVKWGGVQYAKGYRIQYSTSKTFKNYKKKTTTNKSITIKGLKAKKKYYVRVKPFNIDSIGEKVYAGGFGKALCCRAK